jgi:hypothetical protein
VGTAAWHAWSDVFLWNVKMEYILCKKFSQYGAKSTARSIHTLAPLMFIASVVRAVVKWSGWFDDRLCMKQAFAIELHGATGLQIMRPTRYS